MSTELGLVEPWRTTLSPAVATDNVGSTAQISRDVRWAGCGKAGN